MKSMESANPVYTEKIIEPGLPICDCHHHLWEETGERKRYLLDEFLQDAGSGHRIVKTVFIECETMYRHEGSQAMRPVGETEFIDRITSPGASGKNGATSVAAGIVGFADLTLGADVAPVLEAHLAAGRNRLRGIRQPCTWDDDLAIKSMGRAKGMMLDRRFREGYACLERYGLTFDAWQYFTQLDELIGLARAFPGTTIIVNHVGGPLGIGPYAGKEKEIFQKWKRDMKELSFFPHVVVKLGGFGMPRCGFGWHEQTRPASSAELAEVMAPYFHFCIEAFGTGRCMFESNFPVDKVSYSYAVVWNAFKRVCKDFSEKERASLFQDTAVRVYRLEG